MRNSGGQRAAQMPRTRRRGEIGQLRQENEVLREEVLQLTAAVSIFRDVAQRLCESARTAGNNSKVAQRVGEMLNGGCPLESASSRPALADVNITRRVF